MGVLCTHVPDTVTAPMDPTVLVQALVDVARVRPTTPLAALSVKSEKPVMVLAVPARPDIDLASALENVDVLVDPPLPTVIDTVAADVNFAIT